jgi:GxxExxY protein
MPRLAEDLWESNESSSGSTIAPHWFRRLTVLSDPEGTNSITRDIIGCAIKVHKALGPGLLESAYLPCLALELSECGRIVELKKPVPLVYRGIVLDAVYFLDMLVDAKVVVEVKSVDQLAPIHTRQLLTYLRLIKCPVGLLINFSVQVLKDGVRRVINPAASIASARQAVGQAANPA